MSVLTRNDPHHFNPRSPWGERLVWVRIGDDISIISIHAPRGGSDYVSMTDPTIILVFQSTLPVGGATLTPEELRAAYEISIHAPRGGSDFW